MKNLYLIALFLTSLSADIDTQRFTSFSINNGDLQLENGEYFESISSYRSAYDASDEDTMKTKALLREANLFSLYLDDKEEAISLYKQVLTNYSHVEGSEYARYSLGMLYKDLGKREKSLDILDAYIRYYPHGNFSNQVLFTLERLRKKKTLRVKKNPLKVLTTNDTPIMRVLLSQKPHITLSSQSGIYLDSQLYKSLHVEYKNGVIFINNKSYSHAKLSSQTPIYVAQKKRKYKGDMLLTSYKDRLALVNLVPMNAYLYGVVTSESYASWHKEALKAQAVASRTYAYYQAKVRKHWVFDVKDSTSDQVYKGVNGESHNAIEVVDATFGEVLLSENKVILSQYTASSGWHSASSQEIFNANKPYLASHVDRFSKSMPNGEWVTKISLAKFESNLNKRGFNFKDIYALEPVKMGESGRVLSIKVKAKNGEKILRTYSTVRRAAGLKDILFTVRRVGNFFVFDGGGYGHGVGYSQWGGQKMAKEGYTYDAILKFYYANIRLKKLW
ncbi:SpoIID/LytB domain-containing protein [Sulfurimonas sp. SAG-AH-194-I05]|nr:SpoIID/LytB domain-containing protein [Sulfurimonas sp. SAG-AH-194-I05]MDF1875236.1 SpoIID/LytB domain-containing protein [Sulfurimonas sp. SAG-AH-194-I05]